MSQPWHDPVDDEIPIVDDEIPIPDVSNLVTEDDTPVESLFQEKQRRLLTDPLFASWEGPPDGAPYFLASNVAIFPTPSNDCLVPDTFLSLDTAPKRPLNEKRNRSYFVWEHGKPPDVVIEIVSNADGGELSRKVRGYERMRVMSYVVFDPWRLLGDEPVTRFALIEGTLVQQAGMLWLPRAEIGLTLWEGEYERENACWLRWCRQGSRVIPTGAESAEQEKHRAEQEKHRAEQEKQRAEQEKHRAEQEKQRAEQEKHRADRLAARLRELGIDPE